MPTQILGEPIHLQLALDCEYFISTMESSYFASVNNSAQPPTLSDSLVVYHLEQRRSPERSPSTLGSSYSLKVRYRRSLDRMPRPGEHQ